MRELETRNLFLFTKVGSDPKPQTLIADKKDWVSVIHLYKNSSENCKRAKPSVVLKSCN